MHQGAQGVNGLHRHASPPTGRGVRRVADGPNLEGLDGPFALPLDEFIADKRDAPEPLLGTEDDCILPAHGLVLLIAKGGKGKTTFVIDLGLHLASGDRLARPQGRPPAERPVHRERGTARAVPPQAGAQARVLAARDQGRDLRPRPRTGATRGSTCPEFVDAAERLLRRARDRPGDRRPARLARHGRRGLPLGDPGDGRPLQGRRACSPSGPGSCPTTRARSRSRTPSMRPRAPGAGARTRC